MLFLAPNYCWMVTCKRLLNSNLSNIMKICRILFLFLVKLLPNFSFLTILCPWLLARIDGGDVQVSQCVSQNTNSTVVSLVDDMLQTKRMTIEDLIEATEV